MIPFTCRELARRSTSGEFENAGLFMRLMIRLHMAMCKGCECYSRQLKAIAQAVREKARGSVTPEKTAAVKKKVLRRLSP